LARSKRSTRYAAPRAPFFSFSVRQTGDPTAKGSWSSCKPPKPDSRSRGSSSPP
jgi:hypothetical protein